MPTLELTPEILAAHADLSPASRLFVESIESYPDLLLRTPSPVDHGESYPSWALKMLYPMQPWPALVGPEKIAEIETAVTGITALVQEVPERIFDGDLGRIARYYNEKPARIALLFEPPCPPSTMVARTDFLIAEQGIQFLEVNLSSHLGGWSLRFWEPYYRSRPALAAFLAAHGLAPRYRDPLRRMFQTVIDNAVRAGLAANGDVNLALLVDPSELGEAESLLFLRALYAEILRETDPGLSGTVVFGAYPESFEMRREKLFLRNGKRVHALYEFGHAWAPLESWFAAKSGLLQIYNGPLQRFGGDKRCLSLLSEHAANGRFDERERQLIESTIPWSRDLTPRTVEYRNERHDLGTLLRQERERFVIKKGWSFEGRDVVIGIATPRDEWEKTLDEAMASGGWLVQERVESRPYLFQVGEQGASPHSVVWGTFCFGGSFGGGFLRMVPQDRGDGVINSARGATEGYILEV